VQWAGHVADAEKKRNS